MDIAWSAAFKNPNKKIYVSMKTTISGIIAVRELYIFLPRTLTGLPMTRCNEMSRTE